jgi:hypothetical protein
MLIVVASLVYSRETRNYRTLMNSTCSFLSVRVFVGNGELFMALCHTMLALCHQLVLGIQPLLQLPGSSKRKSLLEDRNRLSSTVTVLLLVVHMYSTWSRF